MAVNGPALDKLTAELKTWAVDYKARLRKALSQDYPYGAVKLEPQEQVSRFLEMRGQDYEALILQLNTKYLGAPNAYELVNKDLADFLYAQIGNALKMAGAGND